ncbi:MAG: hypothetical protein JW728_00340 [Candidatus Aureabacteria bacterium]|nr:hypothetical protein [Candidatus Auribacterota bacterium]
MDFGKFKELRFGTSGLRDTVENMTDMECYINTRGFLSYMHETGEFGRGSLIAVGGDRRPSTPRIKSAVAAAIRDMGGNVDDQGLISTPGLTYYAMGKGIPSIMVTGSHIPADRNGIKFTKKAGEVLKSDEVGILKNVAKERKKVYSLSEKELIFDENGMFKTAEAKKSGWLLKGKEYSGPSVDKYVKRYKDVFSGKLRKCRVFFYQHSAVARDFGRKIFAELGAEVLSPEKTVTVGYTDESGKRKEEQTALRSEAFIPVDTESVSNLTMAVFKKIMNEHNIDIGVTMDGDSDRPLLVYRVFKGGKPTDEVNYITGDILGLLAVLGLKQAGVDIDAVAVPISANDAIDKVLGEKKIEITKTKIGSPYVIAAMIESRKKHVKPGSEWNTFSWESNGGFLTGNDLNIGGKTLRALPSRDAVLPLVSVLSLSMDRAQTVSELIKELPARYTHADRKKDFPPEKSRAIIKSISPGAEKNVREVIFKGKKAEVSYLDGSFKTFPGNSEFFSIKRHLEAFFKKENGFSGITAVNYIDGVRIFFSNGDISHLRPSGNAPEFRNYAIASTPERAKEIVELGLNKIIPELASSGKGS